MEKKDAIINIYSTFKNKVGDQIVISSDFDSQTITIENSKLQCVYKNWIQQTSITKLKELIKPEQILLADYINIPLGQRLKSASIQYMDGVGNAYISKPFIYIQGLKPSIQATSVNRGKELKFYFFFYGILYG
ncbi:hypothetical protein MJH12_06665 [bacterium]|nr:hypothetical protein [bacterium]